MGMFPHDVDARVDRVVRKLNDLEWAITRLTERVQTLEGKVWALEERNRNEQNG